MRHEQTTCEWCATGIEPQHHGNFRSSAYKKTMRSLCRFHHKQKAINSQQRKLGIKNPFPRGVCPNCEDNVSLTRDGRWTNPHVCESEIEVGWDEEYGPQYQHIPPGKEEGVWPMRCTATRKPDLMNVRTCCDAHAAEDRAQAAIARRHLLALVPPTSRVM